MRGPIVYDRTAAPDGATLARWAAALDLPVRHWQVIRRLLGRVVALGYDEGGACDWVLKAGAGRRDHAASFAAAADHACTLERLARASGALWLAAAPSGDYRRGQDGEYALMALPYISGPPLAPEHRLSGVEASALDRSIDTLRAVMTGLEDLGHLLPPSAIDRAVYGSRMVNRLEERLASLVQGDELEAPLASRLAADFGRRLEAAPLRSVFGHGELTAWHVLRRSGSADALGRSGSADALGRSGSADALGRSGSADALSRPYEQVSLIDLETLGFNAADNDLSVLVMRTWGLNAAPAVAERLLAKTRAALPSGERAEFEAELRWQWLFAAVRTRRESMSWRVRTEAISFWNWALRQP